ncbi:hypothetical protein FIBSPDRAFT_933206 [Athelia psychrophila]|uniref:Uncharacterized protein n=1 Tax=Athelia psychrophila TaxID=1759441 RepID=A0A166HF12_9AGAM|nr:hypothetical protein FIBSPDRAFT_933206 [Fibularhizoctonia sp. CBS 109695]
MSFSTHGGSAEDTGKRKYPFPQFNTYVTIKLDPVQSVEVLEDEEATAAALNVVSKVYVGYVANDGYWDDLGDDDDEEEDYRPFEFQLLRSGLPSSSPDEHIDKYMCMPVLPNTDHPTRQPVRPSKPLPDVWKNCYLASFEAAILRIPISRANDDLAVTMPYDAGFAHGCAVLTDRKRQKELSDAHYTSNLVPMADFPLGAPGSSGEDNGHADATPSHSVSSPTRAPSIASVPLERESRPVPPPIAILSYDIDSVSTLADPQDLLAEIKFMTKLNLYFSLYEEARTRTLARLAHAIAEAKKLDDATFGRPSTLDPAPQTAVDAPLREEPIEPPSAFVATCRRWKAQLQPYAWRSSNSRVKRTRAIALRPSASSQGEQINLKRHLAKDRKLPQLQWRQDAHPSLFAVPPEQALGADINKMYANRVYHDVGLCIGIFDIVEAVEGKGQILSVEKKASHEEFRFPSLRIHFASFQGLSQPTRHLDIIQARQ